MIRRRSFLIGCSGIVAAPVLAQIALPATATRGAWMPKTAAEIAAPPDIALRVAGWDDDCDSGSDAWVQISSSWRSTWR